MKTPIILILVALTVLWGGRLITGDVNQAKADAEWRAFVHQANRLEQPVVVVESDRARLAKLAVDAVFSATVTVGISVAAGGAARQWACC